MCSLWRGVFGPVPSCAGAARHVEKLREAVKLFLEKVEKRKKEMQESKDVIFPSACE